jgi:cytoskeletal protein RodZ
MSRNVIVLLIVCFLGWFGYTQWKQHRDAVQLASGDVQGDLPGGDASERFDKENSGDKPDATSESSRHPTPDSELGTKPSAPAIVPGNSSMMSPAQAGTTGTFAQAPMVPTAGQAASALPPNAPTRDSEPPNAPNGLRFAGSGTYQWYRQGDLTYRIDTATGKSCIIYATKKQWRDPLVYSNGCGRTT